MSNIYVYRVVREDPVTGKRSKKSELCYRNKPLTVGGLYNHLGHGFKGSQRVLEQVTDLPISE